MFLKKIKNFIIFPLLPIIVVFFLPFNIYILNPIILENKVEYHLFLKNLDTKIEKFNLNRQSLFNNESNIVVKFKDNPYTYIYTKDIFRNNLKVEIIDENAYIINSNLQDPLYKNKKKSADKYCIYSSSDFLGDSYTLK